MGQVLSVYLPLWDVELVRRQPRTTRPARASKRREPEAPPLLLSAEIARQELVARCCGRATREGVAPGMSVAEARALCPFARVLPFDSAYSLKSLGLVAQWAKRFSPVVSVDTVTLREILPSPDGVLLNVTGTAHLFGGEPLMLAEVAARLYRQGFTSRVSIAPTVGAAWALTRFGPSALSFLPEARLTAALAPLPIAALRLSPAIRTALADVGIERVTHLLSIPRESLLVRYGEEVLIRLDQAFGRMNEGIEPIRPLEALTVERLFDGATTQLEAVLLTVQKMLTELAQLLLARESGVRGLHVHLHRINNPPTSREITLGRPSRDPRHLWSLLRPKVEAMHLGYGVEAVVLEATWIGRIRHGQEDIWEGTADAANDRALEELLDTLVNRWGARGVLTASPAASHVPEEAFRLVPATEKTKEPSPVLPWLDRPSQLLARPEPAEAVALQPDHPPSWLRWRGEAGNVISGTGPERITAGNQTRDYFKVQLASGQWLWVYRAWETAEWFVHGLWA